MDMRLEDGREIIRSYVLKIAGGDNQKPSRNTYQYVLWLDIPIGGALDMLQPAFHFCIWDLVSNGMLSLWTC